MDLYLTSLGSSTFTIRMVYFSTYYCSHVNILLPRITIRGLQSAHMGTFFRVSLRNVRPLCGFLSVAASIRDCLLRRVFGVAAEAEAFLKKTGTRREAMLAFH